MNEKYKWKPDQVKAITDFYKRYSNKEDESVVGKFKNVISAFKRHGWNGISYGDGDMEIFCHTPTGLYFSFFVNSEEDFLEFKFYVEEHVNKCLIKWIDTFGLYSIGTPDLPSVVELVDDARWIENEIKEMQDCLRELIKVKKQEQA